MINLYDILEASNGQLFGEPAAHIFTDFCFDAQRTQEANLFIALKTDRGDTHQHMREAMERGALGLLCTRPPDFDTTGITVIIVKDTETALINWSRFILHKHGTQVVAVSGSVGKSITVEAVRQVLGTRYAVHCSNGENSGRLSLPLALAGLTAEHDFLVIELDVNQPGEMAAMIQAVLPDVAVITSISHAHTDAFGELSEIIAENRLLLDRLPQTGLAVFNLDDELVAGLRGQTQARKLTVGIDAFGADLMAYNVVVSMTTTGFDLRFGGERHVGRWTNWLGKHQLYAILAALAVGLHYDIPLNDETLRVLTSLPTMPGRMTPLTGLNNSTLIDDTFATTPQSALAALEWLHAMNSGLPPENRSRLIFVLGDMDHLGSYSQFGHRAVGHRAAEVADVIITEGTDAALAARAALDKGLESGQVCSTYSVQDTVTTLRDRFGLAASDTVIIAGGASARMEQVVAALLADPSDRQRLARQSTNPDAALLVEPARLSWTEIDLDAIATNVRALKRHVGEQVALMAVVKANGYGHGAVTVARTALLNGAEYLAVSSVSEALELTESGIKPPILILNYTPVSAVRQAIRENLTLTVYDLDLARAYDRVARELGARLQVHIKIDTGMGRLGILAKDALNLFRYLPSLSFLEVEGVYTHFAAADEDPEFTAQQVKTFRDVLRPLRASGLNFAYIHAANSAGTLSTHENHFNMVRCGLAIYGLSPSQQVRILPEMRPALTWKTVVAQVKTLPEGHSVGYGRTYVTEGNERIAVLPVGYSDGFRRAPDNWGEVLVHGQRAPIIGRVSMEKTVISVSHIPDVSIGDEVVLLGSQGDQTISADDVAARIGTISYEVVTGILPRSARR